jgi:CheY-like chemotaxis protein
MPPEGFASVIPPNDAQDVASVLLVNGHADETHMYRDYLESAPAGYAVDICDPAGALDRAEATVPAVIVTDLVLSRPVGGGLELIRSLRQNARTRDVAIVVITARTIPSDYDRAFEAGCDMLLPKPCLPEVLLAEVRRAIGLTRRRRFGRTATLEQCG